MRHYRWDGGHRLVGFRETRHGNEITSFTYDYDCFGRRVRKHNVLTGESRLFFWQDDRLIAECDEKLACPGGHPSAFGSEPHTDAHSVRTYIYEPNGNSFRPLAMLGGRGKNTKVFYYINDHLGTPQELVSPSGEIVWSAVYHAYGQQAFTLANHIPQPLRFQGQYHDEESGLSYNRYRYYDVSALRYLSPDPIGLAGGVNAYAYVPSPLSWVDPLGLSGCPDVGAAKQKVNNSNIGDILRTPSTHPEDFVRIKGGDYRNKYTGEIWSKSNTAHSDKSGEWKVGIGKTAPTKSRKITLGMSNGQIIKIDK